MLTDSVTNFNMKKRIVIFGATGQVGLSVSAAVLRDYDVTAVTRDSTSVNAKALCDLGCNVVTWDPTNPSTLSPILQGAHGCFVHTFTDFGDPKGHEVEKVNGMNIADACKQAGVQHVVFNTKLTVVTRFGVRARHMDSKAEIETYMTSENVNLPLTSIIVPCLYEHFLLPPMKPKPLQGCYYGLGRWT